jgi:hypothetical protein
MHRRESRALVDEPDRSEVLVDALTAVRISRRIYQRMLTYTINKITKTLKIAVFMAIGVIVTHAFVTMPLLIVLLLFPMTLLRCRS